MAPSLPALSTRNAMLTSKELPSATSSEAPAAASAHCRRTRCAASGPRPPGRAGRSTASRSALPA
eukprot:2229573-Lingulodinium_polyedra.AAC.1